MGNAEKYCHRSYRLQQCLVRRWSIWRRATLAWHRLHELRLDACSGCPHQFQNKLWLPMKRHIIAISKRTLRFVLDEGSDRVRETLAVHRNKGPHFLQRQIGLDCIAIFRTKPAGCVDFPISTPQGP